jgi:periplasmic copper chaperone A
MVVLRSLAVAAAMAVASPAVAAPQVLEAWSRPAAQGTTGAGFMTLANPDAKPDALVAVESPLAREVQVHQSSMKDGIASMQRVTRVPVPAGGRVTFAPGGYHLMLMGLTKALQAGDTVPATLTFASGAKVKASFVVGLSPPVAEHHHH